MHSKKLEVFFPEVKSLPWLHCASGLRLLFQSFQFPCWCYSCAMFILCKDLLINATRYILEELGCHSVNGTDLQLSHMMLLFCEVPVPISTLTGLQGDPRGSLFKHLEKHIQEWIHIHAMLICFFTL